MEACRSVPRHGRVQPGLQPDDCILREPRTHWRNAPADLFTLSFFRGEAELNDLELRPEVLSHLLGLPPWLLLKNVR